MAVNKVKGKDKIKDIIIKLRRASDKQVSHFLAKTLLFLLEFSIFQSLLKNVWLQ